MANYQETVYATDSSLVNALTGAIISTGSNLEACTRFDFQVTDPETQQEAFEARTIYLAFPESGYK